MMGHNIHFEGVICKIIPKLSLLPLLTCIWNTDIRLVVGLSRDPKKVASKDM